MGKISYNEKMKRLRPFVNFNHDLRKNLNIELSAAEKRRITRHYNQLSRLYSQETTIYRPRRKDNIKAAKRASGLSGSQFKAYPIPSPTGQGRVKVTKRGEIRIETPGARARTIVLDMRRLIADPRGYLEEIGRKDKYYIVNSKYDWNASGKLEAIIRKMEAIIIKYAWDIPADDPEDEEDTETKEQFPIYLIEVDFINQASTDQYIIERQTAQKARSKKRGRKANKKGR